ncbi:hypothetical protein BMS3Bbin02_01549 [bacterium BMS3Bbin02]|nr:hypothetical protein BMS3Bbin02_01549 [bacterium BMS3Bbin02]
MALFGLGASRPLLRGHGTRLIPLVVGCLRSALSGTGGRHSVTVIA